MNNKDIVDMKIPSGLGVTGGCLFVIVMLIFNFAVLAGSVWVVASVLQYMGVL